MAWQLFAYGGFLIGNYVYHRWFAGQPPKPKPASEIQIPRTDEGAGIPLLYGKCRVRSPILSWAMDPTATGGPDVWAYRMDMLMTLGIPFKNPSVAVYRIWVDEDRLGSAAGQAKTHGPGPPWIMDSTGGSLGSQKGYIGGYVEIFDGRATQTLVNPGTLVASSEAGDRMIDAGIDPELVPGYRGMVSVFHHGGASKWELGNSPAIGAYSYEVGSYSSDPEAFNVGVDANPAAVIYDLLTGTFGKLGIPSSRIDGASFYAAKRRLQEEGQGYSRSIEDQPDAGEIIREILEQIDGVVYESPLDGKIYIKLIRGDYDVSALMGVTTENCEKLENFAAGSFDHAVNKVRVVYTRRDDEYRDASVSAHNLASASGSSGEIHEAILRMPGVCTGELAAEIAARELSARSRPIAKCRAIVDRTFYRTMPGDPIRVTWPEYGIDGRVFRVAAVNQGTLGHGKIALDLIEDLFYTWRNVVIPTHPIEPYRPTVGVLAP